ncbi:hypothetical protein SAMN05444359_1332 [Neolewinella agarilytica]|uniref:Uncharacterized protein n=1 Tax=Neolewinella agarilytica TaxID=478744 RepID=A0A1H9N1P0_9BACT|nr:hypothetical protein SAMN05444359_1332 [Neolewinella agarilytica]
MESIKELQSSLSRMIYLIANLSSLKQIKSTVEKLVPGSNQPSPSDLPWSDATLKLKSITTFQDECHLFF